MIHKAEMRRCGFEGGVNNSGSLIYQSMLSDGLTPDLSNSIISNMGGEHVEDIDTTSKAGSVTQKGNKTYYTKRISSTDIPGVRIINNETSSTPSLSPPPIMVLNPR